VYLAEEVHLSRKVAIKVLPPELTFGHGVDRFMREAKTAAALDHPAIIPIYRISSSGKIFWYAMKFLEGKSLDDDLKERKQYSLDDTIAILSQVADALDYGHEHQVIHRDIKPANIMLDKRRRVVVTDFGIAKALTEATLTASGSVIGTPYYMSPEQGMGKPVTGASDQYSLAVTAYQMLSSQRPFEGDSAVEILHKHCMVPPPPLDTLCPSLPRHTVLAIHRALAKKPEQRFETVTAFIDAMREPWDAMEETATIVAKEKAIGWQRVSTKEIEAPKRKRSRLAVTLGAVLALAAGGVGGWLAMQNGGAATESAQDPEATTPPAAEGGAQPPPATPEGAAATPDEVAQPPAPATGTVTVTDLPSGGTVTLDGERRRGTRFELAAGPHVFRLEAPDYRPFVDTVDVAAGQSRQVRFAGQRIPAQPAPRQAEPEPQQREAQPPTPPPALGLAIIRTQGGWARLFVNDDLVGRGSVHRVERLGGTYRIRAERDGFVTVDTTISISASDTTQVVITMREQTP
jgi:hypothetical protein